MPVSHLSPSRDGSGDGGGLNSSSTLHPARERSVLTRTRLQSLLSTRSHATFRATLATSSTGPQSQRSYPLSPFSPHPGAHLPVQTYNALVTGSCPVGSTSIPYHSPTTRLTFWATYIMKDGLRRVCLIGLRQTPELGERGSRLLPHIPARSLPLPPLPPRSCTQKPSFTSSTLVLLPRMRATWSSELSRGGSSSCASVQIWVALK